MIREEPWRERIGPSASGEPAHHHHGVPLEYTVEDFEREELPALGSGRTGDKRSRRLGARDRCAGRITSSRRPTPCMGGRASGTHEFPWPSCSITSQLAYLLKNSTLTTRRFPRRPFQQRSRTLPTSRAMRSSRFLRPSRADREAR